MKSKKRDAAVMKKGSGAKGRNNVIMFLVISALVAASVASYGKNVLSIEDARNYVSIFDTTMKALVGSKQKDEDELLTRHDLETAILSDDESALLFPDEEDEEDLLVRHEEQNTKHRDFRKAGIPSAPKVAIFYDVYFSDSTSNVPNSDAADLKLAQGIVEEQVNQIAKSNVAMSQQKTSVYYVTIGSNSYTDSTFVSKLCEAHKHLICRHLRHQKTGEEDRTLASLHGYCKRRPDDKIIYVHSKGKCISVACTFRISISKGLIFMKTDTSYHLSVCDE